MKPVIAWWSGGITSAVACKKALELFDLVRIIFIDTRNEDEDTYRFKQDCSEWYGQDIETITTDKYESIEDVWRRHKSLNVASGAVCSYMLKRRVREKWEKENPFSHQVFGFEFDKKEFNRAKALKLNHGHTNPVYPLLMLGLDKEDCLRITQEANIKIPRAYSMGFNNNNCLQTGCIQGGIGYWQKIQKDFPEKFDKMAAIEHELTEAKGSPVTMLKNQAKGEKKFLFLKKNKNYPEIKTIDDKEGRPVRPLVDCNGFCGTNDLLDVSPTEKEINHSEFDVFPFKEGEK